MPEVVFSASAAEVEFVPFVLVIVASSIGEGLVNDVVSCCSSRGGIITASEVVLLEGVVFAAEGTDTCCTSRGGIITGPEVIFLTTCSLLESSDLLSSFGVATVLFSAFSYDVLFSEVFASVASEPISCLEVGAEVSNCLLVKFTE